MLYDGKQLRDGSIALAKLATGVLTLLNGALQKSGGQLSGTLDVNSQAINNLAAPVNPNDPARLVDIQLNPWKASVAVVIDTNVASLTGFPSSTVTDGVTLSTSSPNLRVLLVNQTTGSQNGSYTIPPAGGTWVRSPDSDTGEKIRNGRWGVDQGTKYGDTSWVMTTDGVTGSLGVNSTALVFVNTGAGGPAYPTKNDKHLAANTTTADGQRAMTATLTTKPSGGGNIQVYVNGIAQWVGDGVKTADCYFSTAADTTGTTAVAKAALAAGAILWWNGSIAGFQLATTDFIDLDYDV